MATTFYVNNATTLGGEVCSPWQASHAYSVGARCVCTAAYGTPAAQGKVFECTASTGNSGGSQPAWDLTVGNTTTDGSVTWTCREPTSWDNASCYLDYVTNYACAAAGGDTVLVHEAHSENRSRTINTATTLTTPLRILCVDKADDSLSVGAVCSGSSWTIFAAGAVYSYGVLYKSTSEALQFNCNARASHFVLESDGSDVIYCGYNNLNINSSGDYPLALEIINGGIDNSASACGIIIGGNNIAFSWRGGTFKAHASLASLFYGINYPVTGRFEGVDFSSLPATCELTEVNASAGWYHGTRRTAEWINCKFPATFSGFFTNPYPQGICPGYFPWERVKAHNCANGNIVYGFAEANGLGTIGQEATIIRTGGASNGTTGHSFKMVSNAHCCERFNAFISTEIFGWTVSTSSTTFTIEGIWDSETNIQDDEIWMELLYPLNNTDPRCGVVMDRVSPVGTAADQATSTATWTTTGLTNPNKFKLSVTVTPGKAGPIAARVYLAKPSTTVYIDPMITES